MSPLEQRSGVSGASGAPRSPENFAVLPLFRFVLGLETRKAARLGYALSLLCVSPDLPLREVRPTVVKWLAGAALGALRATDLGTAVAPFGCALLLVDAHVGDLPAILRRIATALEGLPWPRPGRATTLSAGASGYPQTATTTTELLQQAFDSMMRARKDGGDRLYLSR